MEENIRVRIVVTGKVQGVCYRYSTLDAAGGYGVTGWVRNRSDGSVEVLAEGNEKDVENLINWCSHGPGAAVVSDISISRLPYTGEFSQFDIRY